MYNLIVKAGGWKDQNDEFPTDRIFEYTDAHLVQSMDYQDRQRFERVFTLPAMLIAEGYDDQPVKIGRLINHSRRQFAIRLDYALDSSLPPLTNADIFDLRMELGIAEKFELSRTHWAIKEVDLYYALLRRHASRPHTPRVFKLDPHERAQNDLVAVMMPFDAAYDKVFQTIKDAAKASGLKCERVDTIWNHDAIIDDVVSLINKATIVVCDLTGRNANVFYETGIAHTLGKRVVMITQSSEDVPFDVQHNRYLKYLGNREGLEHLQGKLTARFNDLTA